MIMEDEEEKKEEEAPAVLKIHVGEEVEHEDKFGV